MILYALAFIALILLPCVSVGLISVGLMFGRAIQKRNERRCDDVD
jgi:hypothetical protein